MILGQGFFDQIFQPFTDSTVYFLMAAISTGLIILKVVLMLVVGVDSDIDIDVDVDTDIDVGDVDSGFSLISILSILSFLMGAGWMGLAARWEWQWGPVAAAGLAVVSGFALMLLSAMGMYQMKKFNQINKYNPQSAIGKVGQVYMTIPAASKGQGKVQITVDGKQRVMPAIYKGDQTLDSFTDVKVLDVQGTDTLIVEPL